MNAPEENGTGDHRSCPHGHGHDTGVARELRALALVALDRIDPLLARLRDAVVDGSAPDAVCPVCAALAAVRAERPELAGRLATHAAGLASALREALSERGAATPGPTAEGEPARPVQRIRVERIRVERAPAGRGTPC